MILLDTSFLIALNVEEDVHHERAEKIAFEMSERKYGGLIISDYVFDEFVTVMMIKIGKLDIAIEEGDRIFEFAHITQITEEIFKKSWEVFRSQKDTRLSFTDCSNLALMKNEKIKYIATFDKDIKKIGKTFGLSAVQ